MDIRREIARYETDFLGGEPKYRYMTTASSDSIEEQDKNAIDFMRCTDAPYVGVQSCATIGLYKMDLGRVYKGKKLRVELLGACDLKTSQFEEIFTALAFAIHNIGTCYRGMIIKNILPEFIPNIDMKHMMLIDPYMLGDPDVLLVDDLCIAWLLTIPLSDKEYDFVQNNDDEAFHTLFEQAEVDIFDIYRKSVL